MAKQQCGANYHILKHTSPHTHMYMSAYSYCLDAVNNFKQQCGANSHIWIYPQTHMYTQAKIQLRALTHTQANFFVIWNMKLDDKKSQYE